jgi:F420-dependent oxidoreductase-like protein
MRFGFKTAPQHTSWPDLLAVWQAADEIEVFESGWTFDHFYPILGMDSAGPCLEGWTVTTALVQATRRLRIGVLVTGVVYRHPAVLANMAATVDIISGGRLELGLGAGWNEEECGAYGIELGSLKERFDRFDEALDVITGLLANTTTDFNGDYFTLVGARCEPKPIQRPHPPICIGGSGERRTLRSVARVAQHWNFPGGPVEHWAAKRDVLHQRCAEIGRDPAEISTSTHLRYDPDAGPGALAELAASYEQAGIDLGIVYLPPPHTPAVLEPIAKALEPLC